MSLGLGFQISVQILNSWFKVYHSFICLQNLPYSSQNLLAFSSSFLKIVELLKCIYIVWSSENEWIPGVALLLLFLVKFVFVLNLHLCKHPVDKNLRLSGLLLNTYYALLLRFVMLLLDIHLLFTNRTCILRFKPLADTSLMKSVETHQHHVLLSNFVIWLANCAKFVFFREVQVVCLSEFVDRQCS